MDRTTPADKYSSPKVEEPRQENKNVLCLVILIASSRLLRLEWRKRPFFYLFYFFYQAQVVFCLPSMDFSHGIWDFAHNALRMHCMRSRLFCYHFTSFQLRCGLTLSESTAFVKNRTEAKHGIPKRFSMASYSPIHALIVALCWLRVGAALCSESCTVTHWRTRRERDLNPQPFSTALATFCATVFRRG